MDPKQMVIERVQQGMSMEEAIASVQEELAQPPSMMDKMQGFAGGLMDQAQGGIESAKQAAAPYIEQGKGLMEEGLFDAKHAAVPAQQMLEQAQHGAGQMMDRAAPYIDKGKDMIQGLMGEPQVQDNMIDQGPAQGRAEDFQSRIDSIQYPQSDPRYIADLSRSLNEAIRGDGQYMTESDKYKLFYQAITGMDKNDPNYEKNYKQLFDQTMNVR